MDSSLSVWNGSPVQSGYCTSRILPDDPYNYTCVERDHCEIKALSKLLCQSNLKAEVSL